MKTSDFDYHLPKELIANYPLDKRTSSRLLVHLDQIKHKTFKDILNYFQEGDLLVVNNTSGVQLQTNAIVQLLNKPYGNEVTSREQN